MSRGSWANREYATKRGRTKTASLLRSSDDDTRLFETLSGPALQVVQILLAQHHQRHVRGVVVLPVKLQQLVARVQPLAKAQTATPRHTADTQ